MTGMGVVRARHSIRLALICAALAVAGGAPGARGHYAEVSARAVAAVRAEARHQAAEPVVAAVAASPSHLAVAVAVARPAAPSLVSAPLYLAHCSLLL